MDVGTIASWIQIGLWLIASCVYLRKKWVNRKSEMLSPSSHMRWIGAGIAIGLLLSILSLAFNMVRAYRSRPVEKIVYRTNPCPSTPPPPVLETPKTAAHPTSKVLPLSKPTPIQAQPSSQTATGQNGAAVGSLSQGDCGVAQIGGSGNVAAPNCAPPERHLTHEQSKAISDALRGKQIIVHVGYIMNAPDAQDYATELCDAIKGGVPATDCSEVWAMVSEKRSLPWYGFNITYKGDPVPEGQIVSHPPDSPVGILISAMLAAGLNRGVIHADPTMKDNEVTLIVGRPPPKD